MLEEIVTCRRYAECKALYDAADSAEAVERLPSSDLMDLVKVIDFELNA